MLAGRTAAVALFQSGKIGVEFTQATILGYASVNGSGEYAYEIDVTDQVHGGKSDTYRMSIPDYFGYDSGEHTLGGGNVTIHT